MSSEDNKSTPKSVKSKWLFVVIATIALAGLTFLALRSFDNSTDDPGGDGQRAFSLSPISETIDQDNPTFMRVGLVSPIGCDAVLDYFKDNALKEVTAWGLGGFPSWRGPTPFFDTLESTDLLAESSSQSRSSGSESGFSTTNIQVEGVDEADIVKTDGDYIYVLAGQSLKIIDPSPENEGEPPVVVAEVELDFYATDMLLTLKSEQKDNLSDTLIIIGHSGYQLRLVQVDIDDRQSPEVIADFAIDGGYVGIRLADNTVRLITVSQPLGFDWETPSGSGLRAETRSLAANKEIIMNSDLSNWVPAYKDNLQADSEPDSLIDCSQMLTPNVFSGLNTLAITTFNASEKLEVGDWQAVGLAASGQDIYATADHVYVATGELADEPETEEPDLDNVAPAALFADLKTVIHQFGLEQPDREAAETPSVARPIYLASGEVDGTLLNQFSMDEYEGDLRVAVTIESFEENTRQNHIKILRSNEGVFEEIGTVSGLGIDERIFAVRFMGPQAYIVTFRQIDPLYALDLSDPTDPQVLGELKIPGFSSYLHPVGDNLLLGIGQDADLEGRTQGLQISLFDTSDPQNPKRTHQLLLQEAFDLDQPDDVWSSSPAEDDHRAFLFYQESSFIPYQINWYSSSPRAWSERAGILVIAVKDQALVVENTLEATRQKDNNPDGQEINLKPIRTVVIDDIVYGITSRDELIAWQASSGELLHLVTY